MLEQNLNIALKEWDTVRDALRSGRQTILLRKGGIADRGGHFALEHERFLIFPTFVHQDYKMLRPEAHARFQPCATEPDQIEIDTAAEVTHVVPISGRAQMDAIRAEHIWSEPLIETRFSYKPEKPLYLLIVRAHALGQPVTIANTPAYAGCKSWVPLDSAIDCRAAHPVIDDGSFTRRGAQIVSAIMQSMVQGVQ